jgi:predicted PurR-regulated permease PerM
VLKLEVSYRGIIFAVLALVALFALIRLWPVLLLISTAFIFMAALLPYVEWLVARGVPRTVAVIGLVAVILTALVGLFIALVPAVVDEFDELQRRFPEDARELERLLDRFGIEVELEERARDVEWGSLISGEAAVDYTQRAIFIVLAIFTIVVITTYLLIDAPRLATFVYQFVPPGHEPQVEAVLNQLGRVVGGYIRGQIITSSIIALFTFVTLLVLGVPNAVAFALLAGFIDIIPIVGATLATLLPSIAAFHESPTRGAIVFVLMILYQQFEDRYLAPRVYGHQLNLPPLIVLIAVLIGAELLGIAGALLALPATAAARVGVDYWLDRRRSTLLPPEPTGEPLAPDPQGGSTA